MPPLSFWRVVLPAAVWEAYLGGTVIQDDGLALEAVLQCCYVSVQLLMLWLSPRAVGRAVLVWCGDW